MTDRWHLVKNLGQALERVLEGKHAFLLQAAQPPPDPHLAVAEAQYPAASEEKKDTGSNRQQERLADQKQDHRQARFQRYQQGRELFSHGWNISAIATHLHLARKTVQKFATAAPFPERRARLPRPCRIDAFKAHLLKRWQAGCHNAAPLYQEIRQRGSTGGYTVLRDSLQTLRSHPPASQPPLTEQVSVRQVVM